MEDMEVRTWRVDNGEGWQLAVRRHTVRSALRPRRRPVAILPGYGMNSFIFTWHPEGLSMAEYFARAGFEFWTVDLRAQGDSLPVGGSPSYQLQDVGLTDIAAVVEHILGHTRSERARVDLVGCSLGATYVFIHVGLVPGHRVGAVVAIGGPLRWASVHPALRVAFSSPALAGAIPFKGTGLLAELALPVIGTHAPWLLQIYLRAEHVDMKKAAVLVRTVEDPVPRVNAQIAEWIKRGDLWIDGRNLTEAVSAFDGPFLCAFGNADGIVRRSTAVAAFSAVGSQVKELLELGDAEIKMAHADVYVGRHSHEMVFRPIAGWLSSVAG
jgi:pimeloyl-ACP methyl ester carboxylesterase